MAYLRHVLSIITKFEMKVTATRDHCCSSQKGPALSMYFSTYQ